jgi:F420-non-reducing hydrogenase iron-sulfur subunit
VQWKVDTIHIMKALEKGADGVLVAGCLEGDCHFKTGNVKAMQRVTYLKHFLEEIGIEAERVQMVTMSAGMGSRFARIATEFTEKIGNWAPIPVKAMV